MTTNIAVERDGPKAALFCVPTSQACSLAAGNDPGSGAFDRGGSGRQVLGKR